MLKIGQNLLHFGVRLLRDMQCGLGGFLLGEESLLALGNIKLHGFQFCEIDHIMGIGLIPALRLAREGIQSFLQRTEFFCYVFSGCRFLVFSAFEFGRDQRWITEYTLNFLPDLRLNMLSADIPMAKRLIWEMPELTGAPVLLA
jgi:hypothetical protein